MIEPRKTLRNVAIVLALTVVVWKLPGGDTGSDTIGNLLVLILWSGLLFFAYRMYMENRTTLIDLPERLRRLLYGSLALVTITLVASRRLWDEGGAGVLLWFALMGAAIYGVVSVWRAYREYP